jgi:hypothetical protein
MIVIDSGEKDKAEKEYNPLIHKGNIVNSYILAFGLLRPQKSHG